MSTPASAAQGGADPFSDEGLEGAASGEQPAEGQGQEPPQEPATDGQGEEPRLLAGKFTSVEALEEAYRHAEQMIGRQGNELGQARQQRDPFDDLDDDYGRQGQQQQQPQQGQLLSQQQLLELFEDDPLAAIDYVATLRGAQFGAQVQQEVDARLGPVQRNVERTTARAAIDALNREFGGEAVDRYKTELANRIRTDESFYAVDEETRYARMREHLIARMWEAGERPQQQARQRDAGGRYTQSQPRRGVHTEGGSNGAQNPQTPQQRYPDADPVTAEFYDAWDTAGRTRDRYGEKPRAAG